MSNGEPTTLPGGNNTITLSPGDQTKIYQHQGRYLVATIKMAPTVDIPAGATIDFSKGNSQSSTGFLALPGEPDWTAVPIVVDPADNTKGAARLAIRHDPSDRTNTITVYAQASGAWGAVQPPAAAGPVGYTIITEDPTVTITSPDNALLNVPSGANADKLGPQDDGGVYTAHFSCKVTDDSGTAIPDYVVEWHEAGEQSAGLFSYQVNAYTSQTASYADALTLGGGLVEDKNQHGYYVRMVTNASGVADLYIVAKGTPGMYVSGVIPLFDYSEFTPIPCSFLVCDPTDVTLTQKPVTIVGETGEPGDYTLDFDQLATSPFVQATVSPYTGAGPSDEIYLICNNKIVAGPHSPPNHLGQWSWVANFLEGFCYSDVGPNAGKQNDVFYVVAGDGGLDVSEHNQFYGTGNTLQGSVPSGPLALPTFFPNVGVINAGLVKSGQQLGVDIDLSNQPANCGWTPQAGDRLTATAYMSGWQTKGTVATVGQATATPVTLSENQTSGVVRLYFPSNNPFKGYDSQAAPPYSNSECLVVYAVQPKGKSQYHPLYSDVLALTLNTAGRS